MNKIRFKCKPAVDIGDKDPTGAPMGIPHTVQRGHRDSHADESANLTPVVYTIGTECHDPDNECGGAEQVHTRGRRELISPELYYRWVHVQPLARCL